VVKFDWYQATVPAEVPVLRAALVGACDGRPEWTEMERAPHGYAFGAKLADMDGDVCRVWWGGCHQHPHVTFSGASAPVGADLLRSEFPGHTVSRADPCIDFAEPGAYDRLQGIALAVAKERKVKVGTAGDHLLTLKGRTLYLGAPSSHTRLRLYDKAEELRQKFAANPVKLEEVPDELARLECQVRPATPEAKRAAAQADPVSLMGSAAWMRELMRIVADLDIEPFQAGNVWRQADHERAFAALLAQYGGTLQRLKVDLGSWDMVGRQIGHDLAERAAAQRRRGMP
jgi:hypothetical protein